MEHCAVQAARRRLLCRLCMLELPLICAIQVSHPPACPVSHATSLCCANVSALLAVLYPGANSLWSTHGVPPCLCNLAFLPHNADQAACSSHAGARALLGGDDKGGPPPIVCKKTPGPLGTNIVCN